MILEVPAAAFHNMIMLCFSEGGGGMKGPGETWGCPTQSALREGLLYLIQHIPKQRRLITFSVNRHGLTRLEKRSRDTNQGQRENSQFVLFITAETLTYSFDQQTDMVTLDRPAVHGGTGVDPLDN